MPHTTFLFRPWVRRAGVSVVAVAVALTVLVVASRLVSGGRGGWASEPAVWAYLALVWVGGLRIFLGVRRPIVELDQDEIVVRPLHTFRFWRLRWNDILGTECMVPGDRLIIYYDTRRGMRFVAVNLNLIRGRRRFEVMMDELLIARGFVERIVERSRYLSRPGISADSPITGVETSR